mgnify:CR=1 FL=1
MPGREVAKIRKNEKIREIKSYHEKKKENYKIHAFAKWGGKHYSKNHQVALEWTLIYEKGKDHQYIQVSNTQIYKFVVKICPTSISWAF